MQLAVVIALIVVSGYFLFAAFLPRLRPRWGKRTVISIYPPAPQEYYRKPVMGGLSCFGAGLFLAGFPTFYFGISVSPVPQIAFLMMFVGFSLGMMGQYRDKTLEGCGAWKRYTRRRERANKTDGPPEEGA